MESQSVGGKVGGDKGGGELREEVEEVAFTQFTRLRGTSIGRKTLTLKHPDTPRAKHLQSAFDAF